jgi:hypothetical protein
MPADIASTTAQRITELQSWQTAYGNAGTASTDLKVKVDAGDCATKCKEEVAYQSGAGSFPNPFNPPGQSNRK